MVGIRQLKPQSGAGVCRYQSIWPLSIRSRLSDPEPSLLEIDFCGYFQALDETWQEYEQKSGNSRASRANFSDAIDFVGWYNANSSRISNISNNDAMHLYYAYHEGNGGYQRASYRNKQWLVDAAGRVQANSSRFASQLDGCRRELDKNWFQRLIS